MDGTQQLVAVGGLGLVAANFWTGQQRPAISGVLWGAKGADVKAGHTALLGMGGELMLVLILSMAAGSTESLGYGMLAIVAALWILWAMHYYGAGGGASAGMGGAGSPTGTAAPRPQSFSVGNGQRVS